MHRVISYVEAVNEALHQILANPKTMLIGQGVTSPWYVGKATKGLPEKHPKRVVDTPTSENSVAGAALGAALTGMHPILCFPRMDFMYYAMDQIANHIANWRFMFGDQHHIPLTIWAIINRGGEQAAQHSQAAHAIYAHLPTLKVVAPSTPYDAKGLLHTCARMDEPVVFVDDRWLYPFHGEVPEEPYDVTFDANIVHNGNDVTIAASSYMVAQALSTVEPLLHEAGINAEVLDIRCLKPLDTVTLLKSVKKTGNLVVVDGGWKTCGYAAEVIASVTEKLSVPVARVTLPDTPAPASQKLERKYYPDVNKIVDATCKLLKLKPTVTAFPS